MLTDAPFVDQFVASELEVWSIICLATGIGMSVWALAAVGTGLSRGFVSLMIARTLVGAGEVPFEIASWSYSPRDGAKASVNPSNCTC